MVNSFGKTQMLKPLLIELETIGENIKVSAKEIVGYYELKKHKPWF
jgi:hypothetical protein